MSSLSKLLLINGGSRTNYISIWPFWLTARRNLSGSPSRGLAGPTSQLLLVQSSRKSSSSNSNESYKKQVFFSPLPEFSRRHTWAFLAASAALAAGLSAFYLLNLDDKQPSDLSNKPSLFGSPVLLAKEKEFVHDKAIVITARQRLFFQFASVEYDGIPYMTPQDFLESVTEDHPRPRMRRKVITNEQFRKYLKNTPQLYKGSSHFFRNLEDRGIVSYSEYLFLLCVLTKPRSNFQIAFNMFDTDGNQRVDKNEFLVVTKIFQRNTENVDPSPSSSTKLAASNSSNNAEKNERLVETTALHGKSIQSVMIIDPLTHIDTTLLVHLFGRHGSNHLTFEQFKKFMEDLQVEILEIEFNEFSKGMNKISSLDFAEIILRYTNFDQEKRKRLLRRLPTKMDAFSREISFDKFLQFNHFMNNLSDFALALKFHTLANRSISISEFQRAVRISSGFELDPKIVKVIFSVFDQDGDGQLSYREFIAVLKDRLRRGLKGAKKQMYNSSSNSDDLFGQGGVNIDFYTNGDSGESSESYMTKFKKCIKSKIRNNGEKYS